MSHRCIATLIAILAFAAAKLPAQPANGPAPTPTIPQSPTSLPIPANAVPTIQTIARQVVLDVVVTDKNGHAVKGLKPSDFALMEDGVPQTLASFTEQDLASPSPAAPPAIEPKLPPNTFVNHALITGNGAITVILFDELSFADAAYARDQVASFMKTLTPGTPICIFKLDWEGLHLIQDFTTDPQALREAVNSKRNAQGLHPLEYADPNRLQNAMSQLAMYLSGFSGRKNLVWFTAGEPPHIPTGLPNDPFPDISTYFDDARGTADILTLSRVALYPIDARGLVTNARVSVQILLQDGALADLAASTGGRAFYSTNGFKQAIAEVVSTGSNYYTLAYNPTNQRWDGSFRKIKVKLANNALANGAAQTSAPLVPPFHLEYRNGYFAQQLAPSAPHTSTSASTHKLISYSPKGDPNGPGAAMASPLRRAMTFGSIGPFRSSSAPRSCPLLTR